MPGLGHLGTAMHRACDDVAERRLAHARAHPPRRHRAVDRLGRGLSVPGRDLARRGRPARPAARHRFLQRLCRRHLCAATATPMRPSTRRSNSPASRRSSATATQFYGWHYPPYFLFVAAALALLPYGLALAVWQAVTLGLYLLVMRGDLNSSFRGAQSASPESIIPRPRTAPRPSPSIVAMDSGQPLARLPE